MPGLANAIEKPQGFSVAIAGDVVSRPHVVGSLRHYYFAVGGRTFLRFAIEACAGVAFLRTIEPGEACVALHVPPGCEVDELMGPSKVVRIRTAGPEYISG
jgi:hypothetical protein